MDNQELLAQIAQLMAAQEQRITANLTEKIEELRAETRQEISSFRAETRQEISGFRAETRQEISGFRAETREEFSRIHEEFSGVHEEISILRQAVVEQEEKLSKVDIVLEQQVDIIKILKEMQRPERQITELREQLNDVASALSIHTNDTSVHVSPAV